MQLLGNSSQKKLIKEIFGSPEVFEAELLKSKSKSFFYKSAVIVCWDKESELYEFFWPWCPKLIPASGEIIVDGYHNNLFNTCMDNTIKKAFVHYNNDPSVGMFAYGYELEVSILTDDPDELKAIKEKIADLYELTEGERPTWVMFDVEIAAQNAEEARMDKEREEWEKLADIDADHYREQDEIALLEIMSRI